MQQYIIKRLLLFIPTVFLLTALAFGLMSIIPGDAAEAYLAGPTGQGRFNEEEVLKLQRKLGTDRPVLVQYGSWLWGLMRGDLGTGLFYRTEIVVEIKPRFPVTMEVAFLSIIFSVSLAVPLGILSAIKQDTIIDYAARIFTFAGISVPVFVIGLGLVYVLSSQFNWLPPLIYKDPWEDPLQNIQQVIWPSITIGITWMSFIARVTRSAMLEVLREDYIRTARSKGLSESRVLYLHALKNAILPVITVSGWTFGILLGGSVIVEKIFVLPGVGVFLLESIENRDLVAVQGVLLLFGLMVVTVNLIVDLTYAWFNPTIRYG